MANEPVAWHYPDGKPDQCTTDKAYAEKEPAWTPMYYKQEWVGLTNEELTDLFYNSNLGQESAVSQAITLLKERNT
jgi:hypothetical protein